MPAVGTDHGQPQAPQEARRSRLTLEPLRAEGPDSLDTQGIPGIVKIILCEIEIAWDNTFHEITITRSDNIFAAASADAASHDPIPEGCILVHAIFFLQFTDSPNPRQGEIRPPYQLSLASPSDAAVVERWLEQRGFKPMPPSTGFPLPSD